MTDTDSTALAALTKVAVPQPGQQNLQIPIQADGETGVFQSTFDSTEPEESIVPTPTIDVEPSGDSLPDPEPADVQADDDAEVRNPVELDVPIESIPSDSTDKKPARADQGLIEVLLRQLPSVEPRQAPNNRGSKDAVPPMRGGQPVDDVQLPKAVAHSRTHSDLPIADGPVTVSKPQEKPAENSAVDLRRPIRAQTAPQNAVAQAAISERPAATSALVETMTVPPKPLPDAAAPQAQDRIARLMQGDQPRDRETGQRTISRPDTIIERGTQILDRTPQVVQAMLVDKPGLAPLVIDESLPLPAIAAVSADPGRGLSSMPPPTTSFVISQPAQTVGQVAAQMAVAISQSASGTTQIALSPEELGKVRMVMAVQESTITMTVHAERPEVTDLLRRHVDTLAEEFRDMGFTDISFSFEGGDHANGAVDDELDASVTSVDETDADTPVTHYRMRSGTTGLDVRI